MHGMITRIAVALTEHTHQGTRTRLYDVLPDKPKIIRPDRNYPGPADGERG